MIDLDNERRLVKAVEALAPKPQAEVTAPALGYSVLANLGDEKQLTLQCFVDSEADISTIHAQVDKAMAVVDRQKAKYRLKDLHKEIAEMEGTLERHNADLATLETNFENHKAVVNGRIAENVRLVQSLNDAAHAKGRAQPVGADKAQHTALGKEIEHLKEELAKAEAERAAGRQNLAVNIGRFNDAIAKKREEVAECEALIGGDG